MNESITDAWDDAPADPDTHVDLEYELQRLAVIKLDERMDRAFMIVPTDEADQEREFIVADPGSVCRLDECC